MTVVWAPAAIEDRKRIIRRAWAIARERQDPQIYHAAWQRDAALGVEGENLDGIGTFGRGQLKDTFLYVSRDGRCVLHYRREGGNVTILRVLPSRSDWQSML